ncbi:NAD(P)-binding protein [Pyrenochaeta sp. DS3sAY3a]|nr:NAD(P)-binding protein [Pyrenochaeta sp. DS3sAY3a]
MADLQIYLQDIKRFENKIVLITGGSSGIGEAAAKIFLDKGAKVINLDLNPSKAYHRNLEYKKCDLTSWNSQLQSFKDVLRRHDRIDVVYANAGIDEGEMAFEDKIDPATGDPVEPTWSTVKINLIGLAATVKLAAHFMRKERNGGEIILCGSRASYAAVTMPVYSATKHAILGLLRGSWRKFADWNIRINMVAPHITRTGLTPQCKTLFEEANLYLQKAEDVGLAVVYLAQESKYNGACISVAQGKYRELEGPIADRRWDIFGQDDFEPKNEAEVTAVMSALYTRW